MKKNELIWVEYDNGESYSDHSHNLVGVFKSREKADTVTKEYLEKIGNWSRGGSCSFQLINIDAEVDHNNGVYLGELSAAWAPTNYSLGWEERQKQAHILHYNWVDSDLYDWETGTIHPSTTVP